MRRIVLIAHNIRSAHNIGSLMRSADGLGIDKFFITGFSPYPTHENDQRLPHHSARTNKMIHKTALGAEESVKWVHEPDINTAMKALMADGYQIAALEQTEKAIDITKFKPPNDVALIVGNEVDGISLDVLKLADYHLMIPMLGTKESFNAAIAAAIAMYHLKYT